MLFTGAQLLFEVTVEDFVDSMVAEAYENLSEDQKQQADFEKVLRAAKAFHLAGVDLFKKQALGPAVKK